MENLLALFNKIQQVDPLPMLSQEIIVVHNAGMQHWLNLSLAQQRGISMNICFALPAQYLWQLIRQLADQATGADQTPYAREVLVWRIDQLLQSEPVINDADFAAVNQYWQSAITEQATLKRFQLAGQLADLYEQYLIFRPDWPNAWQGDDSWLAHTDFAKQSDVAKWQGKLWRLLTDAIPYDPKMLLQQAKANLNHKRTVLPKRISLFGINALPPFWLDFLAALAEHMDIHFFHLNPCFDYWGDVMTQKQAVKQITQWTSADDSEFSTLVGNPLLANYGQQGREFLNLLQQFSTVNIELFEPHHHAGESANTVLSAVQNDILQLRDATLEPTTTVDQSICITSAHSALREVQGLHDWLLHQFNQDPELTPKDVLVMCPQIENYAPYIDAVFARGWQEIGEGIPPLPCSIADRVSRDSEPLVAAFIDLLQLPDARFQVTQIVNLLRLPALQTKFSLDSEMITTIEAWLVKACVHWGLDQAHKQQILSNEQATGQFTWHQGLSRLLLGFAYSDQEEVFADQLLLPLIEGENAILLGKLLQLIEQLANYHQQLTRPRSVNDWQSLLREILDGLFVAEQDNAYQIISQAISDLQEYCQQADYQLKLNLSVVREFLTSHFSQPDPGRQFLVGQVTFCSMLPMRSIPFKVIAILGLNDGEFPRQRQPLAFDLMAKAPARLGDRSRRGDDRYLFLEAIISARQTLYLSYQGRNIRNNKPQQPSLVLTEFLDYLQSGYGWSLLDDYAANLRQLPMQPFSLRNYQQPLPSFDQQWLALAQQQPLEREPLSYQAELADELVIDLSELIQFFVHPAKYFANRQLALFFDEQGNDLSDIEPFSVNALDSYLLKQALLNAGINSEGTAAQAMTSVIERARLSGLFPELPTMSAHYQKWSEESERFAEELHNHGVGKSEPLLLSTHFSLGGRDIRLTGSVPVVGQNIYYFRSSTAKMKDLLTLCLSQLLADVAEGINEHRVTGWYFNTKNQQLMQHQLSSYANAQAIMTQLLEIYLDGQSNPLMLTATLAQQLLTQVECGAEPARILDADELSTYWYDESQFDCPSTDAYLHYFWPDCPQGCGSAEQLLLLYQQLLSAQEVTSL